MSARPGEPCPPSHQAGSDAAGFAFKNCRRRRREEAAGRAGAGPAPLPEEGGGRSEGVVAGAAGSCCRRRGCELRSGVSEREGPAGEPRAAGTGGPGRGAMAAPRMAGPPRALPGTGGLRPLCPAAGAAVATAVTTTGQLEVSGLRLTRARRRTGHRRRGLPLPAGAPGPATRTGLCFLSLPSPPTCFVGFGLLVNVR